MPHLRHIVAFALLTATVTVSITVAALAQPATRPATRPASPPPNLERTMKTMNRTLRQIFAQVDDGSKDAETLTLVGELQISTAQAKSVLPHEFEALQGERKTKAIADYRSRMIGILRAELTLEEAILAGDRKAAREALASIQSLRKDGHEAYDVVDH